MGQGSLKRHQKRLNGYEQKKVKMERERRIKRAEKLAKKGIVITRPNNGEERLKRYKEKITVAHKAAKRGITPVKKEKAYMFTPERRARYARFLAVQERREVKKIRRWLIEKQGMRCGICGLPITKEEDCTVDHIVPRCKGGQTTKGNCQLAHKMCNLLKDNNVSEKKLDN